MIVVDKRGTNDTKRNKKIRHRAHPLSGIMSPQKKKKKKEYK